MGIAVYEFTPNQAKDLTTTTGSIVEVLDSIDDVKGIGTYMVGGNVYVVVAT